MNLDQIATKCFILALFIRDDGERLLLGDGCYDFNQKLQHFQGNTIANDIVEIQGDNGQLLAGQVMRSGAQKFEGYIGDATTNRQTIEQKRSDFMAFFRIKHFYKVVYIFPDGTAIQRQRGYLTDAPTIPEIFQKFPEYSIALNFEDANYYEYAEDEHGDEIYAHIAELALAGGATGGLVWDEIGAVTNGITWSGIQTAQGEYISITNELDIPAKLASVEMLGNATQDGTPTPDNPQPISVVTGENTVKIEAKNIFKFAQDSGSTTRNGVTITVDSYSGLTLDGTATGGFWCELVDPSRFLQGVAISSTNFRELDPDTWYSMSAYILSGSFTSGTSAAPNFSIQIKDPNQSANQRSCDFGASTAFNTADGVYRAWLYIKSGDVFNNCQIGFQLETSGTTATAYEPYQAQEFEVNLGKNLAWDGWEQDFVNRINNTGMAKLETFDGKNCAWWKENTGYGSYDTKYLFKTNFKENTQYTVTFDIYPSDQFALMAFYYTDGTATNFGSDLTPNTWNHRSVTSQSGKTIKYIRVNYNAGNVYLNLDTFQIELGSQATSYSAYFTPIELAKIGNYQDRIYKDSGKWYIEKQVGKVTFDGTEDGWLAEGGGAPYRMAMPDFYRPSSSSILAMCDHFEAVPYNANWNNYTSLITTNATGSATAFKFRYTAITSLADWKTWLGTHNTTVYCALATPTTTEITNEALIAQLDALGASSLFVGLNNIGTETLNAVPTLKIEYYTEYELDGAGYEWEPGGNTAKTIVTVAGVDSAWPIWTVQGGAQNPTLTNITTGQTITWQGFVPEGQTLTINMAEMTADLAGANVFEYITGEWIRLAPGNNTLVYTAGSADKPSTLSWNGVLA